MLIYLNMIEDDRSKERFSEIYHEYKNLMFYAADQILHNEQDAEDAVHEAFLVVIDRLDTLWEGKGPYIKAFVLAIVENKAIDLWRRRRHLSSQVIYEEQVTPAPQGSEIGLAEAIARLPAEYRSVILLRYDMGFSTREIAKMLGKKEGTVTRTITRAKDRLARELDAIRKEVEGI